MLESWPGASSPSRKSRPTAAGTPSTRKNPEFTRTASSCSGSPEPVRFALLNSTAPIASNAWTMSRASQKLPCDQDACSTPRSGNVIHICTIRSDCGKTSGFRRTV